MIRGLLVCLLAAPPAAAWEFSADTVCRLSHDEPGVSVTVTYDPGPPQYAISITLPGPWADGPVFAMRFDGARPNTIHTERHFHPGGDRATLSVTDRGFGNVLNGLEFNDTATALIADQEVAIPLDGAAPAVRAFRGCAEGRTV